MAALLVGLFLGAGVVFVYHIKNAGVLSKELVQAQQDSARLEKVQRELKNLLANMERRIDMLEGKRPSAPESK
jgi:uncharacterized protein HemX